MTSGKHATLAVTMILRDEEEVLARALDSIVGVADQLIIVDTGSTDRTLEIARSYEAKFPGLPQPSGEHTPGLTIGHFEWIDDFAAARNHAINLADADWILHLDADEELVLPVEGLRLDDDQESMGQYLYVIPAPSRERLTEATERFRALRLFRNVPWNRFERRVHEHVPKHEGATYADSEALILHFGPSLRPHTDFRHSERNLKLLQMAAAENPQDGGVMMHLGREHMKRQQWETALRYFRTAVEILPQSSDFIAPILRDSVMCLMSWGHVDEAIAMQQAAEQEFPDYTDLVFLRAKMAEHLLGPEKAEMAYRRCLKMGDPPSHYPSWGGTGSFKAEAALERLGVV